MRKTFLLGVLMTVLGAWAVSAYGASDVADGLESVRVFTAGEGGFPYFRIPAVVTSRRGTVLAFAEGRHHATDHGRNDIVLKRSADNGRTWGPLIVVDQDPELVMVNPSPVVLNNGTILLFYETFPFGYHARKGKEVGIAFQMMKPGFEPGVTQRLISRYSLDDGRTWSKPRYLEKLSRKGENLISSGSPANGIQLWRGPAKGRVLMPMYLTEAIDRKAGKRTQRCAVLFSDDRGRSWKRSSLVPLGDGGAANECLIAELDDGRLIMNARAGGKNRLVAFSEDAGETWSPFAADPVLTGRPCHSGLLRYSYETGRTKSRLLFSNNFNMKRRATGTLRVSYDNGESWPVSKTVVPGLFGYSQLTRLVNGNIGMLYEPFESPKEKWHIDFVSVPLGWLTDGEDTGDAKPAKPE
jgi:sialidase-1